MKQARRLPSVYQQSLLQLVGVIKQLDPKKIILYGSAASGFIDQDSDLDLCVIKDTKDVWKIKEKITDLLWEVGYNWEIEPDIKIYPPSVFDNWLRRSDPFITEIAKGKILYEK